MADRQTFLRSARILPNILATDINFVARGMLPTRRVYAFFDNTPVDEFIQAPNIVYLSTNLHCQDLTTRADNHNIYFRNAANSAEVLLSTPNGNTNTTMLLVANVSGIVINNSPIVGNTSTKVSGYIHRSGVSTNNSTNTTIQLSRDAAVMANNYWGTDETNTIFFVAGTGMRQYGNISAYNNVSRTITITNTLDTIPDFTTRYTIGPPENGQVVGDDGIVAGTFYLPEDAITSFRTGDRVFKLTDSPRDDDAEARTFGEGVLYSATLSTVESLMSLGSSPTESSPTSIKEAYEFSTSQDDALNSNAETEKTFDNSRTLKVIYSPLAQTFFVEEKRFPNGIFLTSVDLFFGSKDDKLPIGIEIRQTENGYPNQQIFKYSKVVLPPQDVNISDAPSVDTASTRTRFEFRSPVYIPPGEHALVLKTVSQNYSVYIAELGQARIGTDNIVSEQPYIGSLFKSQNGSTWTAYQNQDLMFKMRRASFDASGSFVTNLVYRRNSTDAAVDLVFPHFDEFLPQNTTISRLHSTDGGASYKEFIPDRYVVPEDGRFHITAPTSYKASFSLTTDDAAISPMIRINKSNIIAIQKYINTANLSAEHIDIIDGGTGYTPNSNVNLVFSDGSAAGYAIANSGGSLDEVVITSGGSDYVSDMTVTPASGNATFNFVSEEDAFGGPVLAKYITRMATLAPEFDAGDLRLFLVATKPAGTSIHCYYKIKSQYDPEPFDSKRYIKFEQVTADERVSRNSSDLVEFEYKPNLLVDKVEYVGGNGETYSTFNQYAIKIVLVTDDTTKHPVVYNMRCIALAGVVQDVVSAS